MKFYGFIFCVIVGYVQAKKSILQKASRLFSKSWTKAVKQSLFEQDVEDVNSLHKIEDHLVRRLIVMPLMDAFKPNQADLMHGKIQYGDKCSLPSSVGRLIYEKQYEVPWLFEITPVRDEKKPIDSCSNNNEPTSHIQKKQLSKAYISPLDFRAPENYIFLPKWLMNDLKLQANDLVDISFVRIKLADLVVFQPLSLAWDELMQGEGVNLKVLLEHEINKYSSLTAGTTIYIEIKDVEYPLYVKQTIAEGGVAVKGVRVQDSDIRTDIDRSVLDAKIEAAKHSSKI